MERDDKYMNGEGTDCRFQLHTLEELNKNWARTNKITEERDTWIKEYIDRSMPIKSHFWILLGSLSILSGFAAIMTWIQKTH